MNSFIEDHSDQEPLIAVLDDWFEVLRKRTGALLPLKPARPSDLDRLSEGLGVELPPDVVALYEYTNGAWRDKETPLARFLPDYGHFPAIRKKPYSMLMELDDDATGLGFDDWPGTDWRQEIPVFFFAHGEQASVMCSELRYQSVAMFGTDGLCVMAPRLADFLDYALELEERGMLNWELGPRIAYSVDDPVYPPHPFDPDRDRFGNPWKPVGSEGS